MRRISFVGGDCPWWIQKEIREVAKFDDENPEIIFGDVGIYTKKGGRKKFQNVYKNHKDSIYISLNNEYLYPDLNIFDYAITWDKRIADGKRIIHVPTCFRFGGMSEPANDNMLTFAEAKELVKRKKFCCFLYSNPDAHPVRDKLFYEISRYKHVDNCGRHLNNVGTVRPAHKEAEWESNAIDIKKAYKFSITSENACGNGYTSEKILHSFQAHSIPIYFGNPDIEQEFNAEAMINVHRYASMRELIDRIKEIDEDDSLWASIVSKPWRTPEQIERQNGEEERYKYWIREIVENPKLLRPMGTWVDEYYRIWFSLARGDDRIPRKIRHLHNVCNK